MVDDCMNIKTSKKKYKNFSTSEMILLVILSLLIGLSIGVLLNKTNIITKERVINDKYVQEFAKNYEYILNNYYDEIDKDSLINNAIKGMMDSLNDPYSMYLDEENADNFSISLEGSYEGIGLQIAKESESGYMIVGSIFKNSPASEAGLKVGDKIVSIDGKLAKDMTANQFSDLVKKSDKDKFVLQIIRDDQTIDVTLNKNVITLSSVTSQLYEKENKKIGYIYIGVFANNTYIQFKNELEKLEDKNIDSLIIDVRGNTGGHLTSVNDILDLFLNNKQIMYQFQQDGKITKTYGTGNENKPYDIAILCDGSSASASEVLVAGLKDNLNSKIIGKKTYGKGTVQELVTLSTGMQYKITVKKWLTPTGEWVNDAKGIIPDIEVDLDSKYYETYKDEDDNQLQTALEYLYNK